MYIFEEGMLLVKKLVVAPRWIFKYKKHFHIPYFTHVNMGQLSSLLRLSYWESGQNCLSLTFPPLERDNRIEKAIKKSERVPVAKRTESL